MSKKEKKAISTWDIIERIDCDNTIAELDEGIYSTFRKDWREYKEHLDWNATV